MWEAQFQNQICLAGRTSLIQTNCWSPEHPGRLQWPDHPRPGLLLAAQGLQLLVTSAPLMTTGSSASPATVPALFRCEGRHPAQEGIHVSGWGLLRSWLLPGAALPFLLPGTSVLLSDKHHCMGEQAVKITQYTQQLHRGKSASWNFNCKLFHGPSFQTGP